MVGEWFKKFWSNPVDLSVTTSRLDSILLAIRRNAENALERSVFTSEKK